MTDHPITVTLPDTIFDPLREIAQAKAQSMEQVVIEQLRSVLAVSLPALEPDEEQELIAFKFLSDDTLRGIAREQMPDAAQEQMHLFLDRNSQGTITGDQYSELAELVERGQRLTLRKAWAAGILMERGYTISGSDMSSGHA